MTMDHTPPADAPADVAADIGRFADELRGFRTSIETKVSEQSERLDAIDRREATRSPLSTGAAVVSPHTKAMDAYLRRGDEDQLRRLPLEEKALGTTTNGDGGYLVDPQTSETISTVLREASSLRGISTVVKVDAGAYDVLVDHGDFGAGWQSETAAATETSTPTIDRISIPLHELSALPKASQRLLDDSAFDLDAWLADRISDRFARAENAAFVSGDGVDKPTGFLTNAFVANASWAWGSIGYVATGVDGAFQTSNPGDALIDLVYGLDAPYRRRARFVMNSTTAGVVRKFKDAEGRYLWTEAMGQDQTALLFGYPVVIAEDMPDIGSDAMAIAFGDFTAGYVIAERPDLRILRDPYSAKPNVLFYATKRVGGSVADYAAIKTLKFGVS